MRRYETVWVVNGDLPDEAVKAANDKFTRIITTQGGTIVAVDDWGRRKLAYRVKGRDFHRRQGRSAFCQPRHTLAAGAG